MRKLIFTSLFITISLLNINAQGEFGHVTPTTSDFMKYGETQVSYFNGKINVDIPIYQISDHDFNIPINLTYTSDGFKPAKRAGLVGLDWFLNVGGCITREVYGGADDSYPVNLEGELVGYWWASENTQWNNNLWWNFDPSVVSCDDLYCDGPLKDGYYADYQQDLFSFNFMGHSGQFMIDNTRHIQSNKKGYIVSFSSLGKQYKSSTVPSPSQITIVTPDGYTYDFGGDLSALEFSMSFEPGVLLSTTCPTILAWHLHKITSPSGSSVTFNYKQVSITASDTQNSSAIWQSTKSRKTSSSNQYNYSAVKSVVIESIEIDGGKQKVTFYTSPETGFTSYYTNSYPDYNHPCFQLDSVIVSYNLLNTFKYSLNYETKDKRRFLSEFIGNDNAKYKFKYNHCSYPIPEIDYIDWFGYWRSNNTQGSYGLLSEVDYPTGGKTLYTYEKNSYAKRVEFDLSTYGKKLVVVSGETGGARISKSESFTNNNSSANTKEYFYTSLENTNSGILYQYPPFDGRAYLLSDSWINNYNIGEPHIGYSSIVEKNSDLSYIRYNFSDYVKAPDQLDVRFSPGVLSSDMYSLVLNGVNKISSNAARRGLLTSKIYYNAQDIEVKREEIDYKHIIKKTVRPAIGWEINPIIDPNQVLTDEIVSFRPAGGGSLARKITLESNPIIYRNESTSYLSQKEYYVYNQNDLLKQKKTVTSTADTLRTYYKYPSDFLLSGDAYDSFVESNNLTPIIEEKQYKNNTCLYTTKRNYKLEPPHIEPRQIFPELELQHSLPQLDNVQVAINDNPLRTTEVYNNYDDYQNLIYKTSANGMNTVYIWGYKGQYLVAKIENSTYDNVKNALGGTTPESLSELDTYNAALINGLKSNTQYLNRAFVTTYTYKPLVGLQTITDSRGVVTTYNYDNFNRLISITDNNGKLLKTFNYNYKQQ